MQNQGRRLLPQERKFVEELYKDMRGNKSVLFYIRRYIIDVSFVEDVIQQAFLIACIKIEELMASPNSHGYMMCVIQNTIKNFNRTRGNITRMLVEVSQDDWLNNYPDYRQQEEELDFLYGDLLVYKEYELLKQFAVKQRPIAEIAQDYGITTSACKQWIYRAKKKLRKILQERN